MVYSNIGSHECMPAFLKLPEEPIMRSEPQFQPTASTSIVPSFSCAASLCQTDSSRRPRYLRCLGSSPSLTTIPILTGATYDGDPLVKSITISFSRSVL